MTYATTAGEKMSFKNVFSKSDDPYEDIIWEKRVAQITNDKGEVVFEQRDVEVPSFWSQLATNVVVSKYFYGAQGSPERETSVRQLVDRVAEQITEWGILERYFEYAGNAYTFQDELKWLLIHQYATFNSPVWFNLGVEENPQCSACFINSIEDSMSSILTLAKTEGMLFKQGSGTGTNLSTLRGSTEGLATGGTASGPVSFMRGFDAFAGVIQSGGRTRRSAKMVILDCDHPDIEEFIQCKHTEELKAHALIASGYEGGMNGEAYKSIFFQNSNNSVRVTDEFMEAVRDDAEWTLTNRKGGGPAMVVRAKDLMRKMAECAHACGDPGIQYDSEINRWHTCADTTRISASNPCSEYMFVDDSACNLASINLLKFKENGSFNYARFRSTVRIFITAMDILVGGASYPTPLIEKNSHDYRPLGLGYANLGALLMAKGLAYDSDEGRTIAAEITSVMGAQAYLTSAELAAKVGPCEKFEENRESFLKVVEQHAQATSFEGVGQGVWEETMSAGQDHGFRNCQVTVLAPTGTIAFFMDCDTTGIEPEMALVKYKKLAGGGMLKIVNNTVPAALEQLGYSSSAASNILRHIEATDTIEGSEDLYSHHLEVFDCAFKPAQGERSIEPMGHVRMMAAVQPFLSGAISKTVNLPSAATVEDIENIYMEGWKRGLKAVAVYRDGSKKAQAVALHKSETETAAVSQVTKPGCPPVGVRKRLPDDRQSFTHKFTVAGHEGYIHVGLYESGDAGEIFITMSKQGSTVRGMMDAFATSISTSLQYGVPLSVYIDKFSHTRFEPSGFTANPDIRMAKSIIDYIFRWLAVKFPAEAGNVVTDYVADPTLEAVADTNILGFQNQTDAPACQECGNITVRNGSCYKCLECGQSSGCS